MFPLTRSLETLFILDTIRFIVSGLVWMVLIWLVWKEPARRQQWIGWILSFLLLVVSFGLGAWTSYRLLVSPEESALAPLHYGVSGGLETLGLAGLAWAVLGPSWGRWAAIGLVAAAAELGALLSWGLPPDYPPSLAHSVAATVVSFAGFAGTAARARGELRYAGLAFLLLAGAHLTLAAAGTERSGDYAWSVAALLNLLALTGMALAVERRSADLFTRVFIRLNLTFIFLAGVLMALASQAERNERMDFARRELAGLAEFLRGHIMYYLEQGAETGEILASPVIFRRIVADFGSHHDLRVVRIQAADQQFSVIIDDEGIVSHRLDRARNEPAAGSYRSPTVVVAEWPIFFRERQVGAVVLEQTQRSVNLDMAGSILVIFFAFTSAVAAASFLIGVIVYDASERLREQVRQIEQSERQLMQAAKLASLGELVSGVAHEINNPLGVIVSRTEYLQDLAGEGRPPGEFVQDLDVIGRQTQRIGRTVQDLLSFARPHAMELRQVPVAEVIERSLKLTATRLRDAGVRLRIEVPAEIPALRADVDRLEQVLINLINNAADAMPDGGELRIRAEVSGSQVLLSVGDTGMGIPEEDLKRIFDPFFSTKPGRGTGLGLSISYGIIRDHGGRIWAESRPRRGATFFVSLPAEVGRDRTSRESARHR